MWSSLAAAARSFVLAALLLAGVALPAAGQSDCTGVQPPTPYPGHPVTITGTGLSGTTDVLYFITSNNTPSVDFRVVSDSEVRARVPETASSTGFFSLRGSGVNCGDTGDAFHTVDADGPYGSERALSLDGSDDYVELGDEADFDLTGNFSITFWMKVDGNGFDDPFEALVTKGDNSWRIQRNGTTGTLTFDTSHGGGSFQQTTGSIPVDDGEWHHVAVVYDRNVGEKRLYVDGDVDVQNAESRAVNDNNFPVRIGSNAEESGREFGGQIDQVRVWTKNLTTQEIWTQAHRTVDPSAGGLLASYRFDAPGSDDAFEMTSDYRYGTLTNGPTRVPGARIGQESAATNGSDASVGPSGGSLSATNVSAGPGASVRLYQYGAVDRDPRRASERGEDFGALNGRTRSDVTWGIGVTNDDGGTPPSADLTIDYSGVDNLAGPLVLVRRSRPGAPWQTVSGWTRDRGAKTFTTSGPVPDGEYAVASANVPDRIYVDADATGASTGASWANAFPNLQSALDAAPASAEIWIAGGTYTPDPGGSDPARSFRIAGDKDGLNLYGGFDGTDGSGGGAQETRRSQRDPQVHRTVLSGDLEGDDAPFAPTTDSDGDTSTPEGTDHLRGTNSNHVIVLDGSTSQGPITQATVIDGVVVTAGNASGSLDDGAGLFCDGTGNGCSPRLSGVVFAGNATSSGEGGAIYVFAAQNGTSRPIITDAAFVGNTAGSGGAVHAHLFSTGIAVDMVFINAVFAHNVADTDGGAIYYQGDTSMSMTLTNTTFASNEAGRDGGAGSLAGERFDVRNAIFWGNRAADGGDQIDIFDDATTLSLSHTIVEGGTGGIAASGSATVNYLDEDGTSVSFANSTNLDQDPLFVDPSRPTGSDGMAATLDDGANVSGSSPALDAGDTGALPLGIDTDVTGAERVQDRDGDGTATVNVGAYEVPQVLLPTASTGAPEATSDTEARFSGQVTPNGASTTVEFRYREVGASSFTAVTAAESPLSGGASAQAVTATVSGLSAGTEYEVRVVATNSKGLGEGELQTLVTPPTGLAPTYTRTVVGEDGTGNDTGWRMLSLPAQGRTRAALEDDLDFSTTSGALLYRWQNDQWVAQTQPTDPLPRGTGFILYFFDDATDPLESDGILLDVDRGAEDPQSDAQVSSLAQGDDFFLLGNPYDVAFDLGALAGGDLPGAGFQATVQVWDPDAGQFRTVTQGTSGDEIPAWQGFIAQRTTSGSGQTSLAFGASGRQSSPSALFGRPGALAPSLATDSEEAESGTTTSAPAHAEVRLDLTVAGPSGDPVATDAATYWLDDRAQEGYDAYEAQDLPPPTSEHYATLAFPMQRSGSGSLVHRVLAAAPHPGEQPADRTVPLTARGTGVSGEATLSWPDSLQSEVPADWTVRLRDTDTGETVPLRTQDLTFDLSEGGAISTPSDARFRLEIRANPIPAEMASFQGSVAESNDEQAAIELTWKTVSEENNAGFRVQRTSGAATSRPDDATESTWATIGSVDGAGTTAEPQTYRFTDADLPYAADSLTYRLVQVDTDGRRTATDPIVVERGAVDEAELLGTYPNPATRQATVRYAIPESASGSDATLRLYDVLGRQVRSLDLSGPTGRRTRTLDVQSLSSGVYFLRLRTDTAMKTQRLTVVR